MTNKDSVGYELQCPEIIGRVEVRAGNEINRLIHDDYYPSKPCNS